MATVNNEIIIRLNDQASAGLKNIQSQVGSTEKAFASLGSKLIGAFGAFEAGKAFISLTAGLETAKIGFATLLGSQQKALQMMKDIDEFASKTPFEKTTLTPLVQQMIGMGFEAQKAIPTLQVLGDSMSALGRGNEDLQGVVLAMGQIQTKGKLATQELLQMAERGLPVFQILEEKLHLTKKQLGDIGNAGISSSTAINALITGLNERFGGSMAKMSATLVGQWSNAMDNIKSLVANSGQFLSDKIKGLITKFNEWFDKNRQDISDTFDALFQYVGDIFDTVVQVLGTLGEIFGSVMDAITMYTQDAGKNQASTWKSLFMFIANTVAVMGAVISVMIRGLSVSLGVVWNSIQIVASGIVMTIEAVVAGAFYPIEKVINGVIHGINLIRGVMGQTAIDTVHFSENLYNAAVDTMKQSATENGQDISNILKTASDGMASDVGNAISKIEGNFAKFNSATKTAGSNTSDLQGRINSALKDMGNFGKAGEMAGDSNANGSKQAKEAMKKLQEQAEEAVKKISDGFQKTQKEIDSAREKLKTITEDWKKYKDEGTKALSGINAEITKFNNETGKLKISIQSEGDQALAKRAVDIKNRIAEIDKDPSSDTSGEKNKLLEEQAYINSKVDASILKQAESYDALSEAQKIVFDNQKKMSDEMKKRDDDLASMAEKKAILELQANQKSIRDKTITTQMENGIMKAFYTDTAGKLVEIKNQENIDLALSIQSKQAELQKDYDDTNQILKKKLSLQKSHLEDLKVAYAQYHANLKVETAKLATDMIAYYNNIAESLKALIALQRTAGVGTGGGGGASTSSSGTRAFGGPVSMGQAYLVGEKGPELFVPTTAGKIVQNGQSGGGVSVVVNIGGTYNVRSENDISAITRSVVDEITRKMQLGKLGIL